MGLLGGASTPAKEGKISKLAALAAKRRRKENEKPVPAPASGVHLEKPDSASISSEREPANAFVCSENNLDTYSKRMHLAPRSGDPQKEKERPEQLEYNEEEPAIPHKDVTRNLASATLVEVLRGSPSSFASTMTHQNSSYLDLDSALATQFSGVMNLDSTQAKPFDFTDPSPDDVVTKAQKGSQGH